MFPRFAPLVLLLLLPAPASAVEVDPCLPNDSQVVFSIAVRDLLDAPVVKKQAAVIEDVLARAPELPELAKALGVQPLQDVERVTLAGPLTLDAERFLLIAHGRFKVKTIEAAARDYAKKSPEELRFHEAGDQRTIYEYREPKRKAPPLFVCVLDEETVVASPGKETVLDALARKTGKKQSSIAPQLKTLLGKMDGKATLWVVGLATPELKKRLAAPAEFQRLVDSLQHFRGSVTLGDGVQADFVVQTNDAAATVEIRKFVEGIKAILILAATSQDKKHGVIWADLLSALKVANEQDTVTLRGQVTAEQVEKSVQNSKKGP